MAVYYFYQMDLFDFWNQYLFVQLVELRDRLRSDLAEKQEKFNKDFLNKIDGYLKVLSKEKNYSYVFTYVKGNPATIVYAKDTLNISNQVIHALNEQYKKK